MKKLIAIATFIAFGAASATFAGTRVEIKDSAQARAEAVMRARSDHPQTQVAPNGQLRVVVTSDMIMRSCCMPPHLVVGGKITNVSGRPIDYVRLHFAFEDRNGKVLHGESLYNHHAESLSDDAWVQKILNEKPHFDPIRPGQSDTFRFSIPCSELPRFSKVELFSNDIKQ
ncbi:FxLYD domain-containing protein [Candidatus Binatus sp.]|uniref:FxLYD domain-containing protein n=1 Tax=Candidatus Binatus sp. TaxID=2811406 RepID=UPI002F95EF15